MAGKRGAVQLSQLTEADIQRSVQDEMKLQERLLLTGFRQEINNAIGPLVLVLGCTVVLCTFLLNT
jgi:hypothetical protein